MKNNDLVYQFSSLFNITTTSKSSPPNQQQIGPRIGKAKDLQANKEEGKKSEGLSNELKDLVN